MNSHFILSTVCKDLNNNTIRHGEEFRPTAEHCTDCLCLDGETVCPIVDCPPPPGPGCIPEYEEGACCPKTYNCGGKHWLISKFTEFSFSRFVF